MTRVSVVFAIIGLGLALSSFATTQANAQTGAAPLLPTPPPVAQIQPCEPWPACNLLPDEFLPGAPTPGVIGGGMPPGLDMKGIRAPTDRNSFRLPSEFDSAVGLQR